MGRFVPRNSRALVIGFVLMGLGQLAITGAAVAASGGEQVDGATRTGLFADMVQSAAADPAPNSMSIQRRYVDVQFDQLVETQNWRYNGVGVLTLNLFPNAGFTAVVDRVEAYPGGGFVWIGHLEGYERSQVVLAVETGVVVGNIRAGAQTYTIRYAGGAHVIDELDVRTFPDEVPPVPVTGLSTDASWPMMPEWQAFDDGSTVDMLVVYTTTARQAAGGTTGMHALINLAIAETNVGYANSGVNHRVRLVHWQEVGYDEAGFDFDVALDRLKQPADEYLDSVHTLRDTYCADQVTLIVEDGTYCGIGYIMSALSSSFEAWAFSIVSRGCATGYYSFAHELGHNMGCAHDPANAGVDGVYTYSYGYQDPSGDFRTIMAYDCPVSCNRINYWSNPNLTYGGEPMGVANAQDNTRTLNNTAYTVANFRTSCAGPCEDGFEPDNTQIQARAMVSGTQTHSICPTGDADWIAVTLLAESTVVLTTSGPGGDDTVMTLYNAAGGVIESDDNGGAGSWAAIDRVCGVDALPAGTYYVEVREVSDTAEIASYDLTLAVASCGCPADAYEPDNSLAQAQPITSVTQTHNICPANDSDIVTFTLGTESQVVLETSGPTGDSVLGLFNSLGILMESNDDGGAGLWSRIDRVCGQDALSAGTYYAEVHEYGKNDEIPAYLLSLTTTPCTGCTLPATPTGAAATDGTFCDRTRVSWNAASGATSYNIYRSQTTVRPGTPLATDSASPYDDLTAVAGTTYYYWVQAVNSCGVGGVAGPDTGLRRALPAAPTGVSASYGTFPDWVRVLWGSASGAISYNIYRARTNARPSIPLATVSTLSYEDTSATPGVTYYYWVQGVNGCGAGAVGGPDTGQRAGTATCSLAVTSPSGGKFARGSTLPIRWSGETLSGGNVRIQLRKKRTFGWRTWTLTESTPNDGSYDWVIPTDWANGKYTVRIQEVGNLRSCGAVSPFFQITDCTLTVTAPSGGEVYNPGQNVSIQWQGSTKTGGNVRILALKKTPTGWKNVSVIASSTANDGDLLYTIPSDARKGKYRLLIADVGAGRCRAYSRPFYIRR